MATGLARRRGRANVVPASGGNKVEQFASRRALGGGGVSDENSRRDYERARLAIITTRCSPSAADPNRQAIGGARSGGE